MPNILGALYNLPTTSLLQLYYVVDEAHYRYIVGHQHKLFPPRFFNLEFFCPMQERAQAYRVANEKANWHRKQDKLHILRCVVNREMISSFIEGPPDHPRARIIIPHKHLGIFNQSIVGLIERIDSLKVVRE